MESVTKMWGSIIGTILFITGFLTLLINIKEEVPKDDFGDMPVVIKIGTILVVLGVVIILGSVIYLLITNLIKALFQLSR